MFKRAKLSSEGRELAKVQLALPFPLWDLSSLFLPLLLSLLLLLLPLDLALATFLIADSTSSKDTSLKAELFFLLLCLVVDLRLAVSTITDCRLLSRICSDSFLPICLLPLDFLFFLCLVRLSVELLLLMLLLSLDEL